MDLILDADYNVLLLILSHCDKRTLKCIRRAIPRPTSRLHRAATEVLYRSFTIFVMEDRSRDRWCTRFGQLSLAMRSAIRKVALHTAPACLEATGWSKLFAMVPLLMAVDLHVPVTDAGESDLLHERVQMFSNTMATCNISVRFNLECGVFSVDTFRHMLSAFAAHSIDALILASPTTDEESYVTPQAGTTLSPVSISSLTVAIHRVNRLPYVLTACQSSHIRSFTISARQCMSTALHALIPILALMDETLQIFSLDTPLCKHRRHRDRGKVSKRAIRMSGLRRLYFDSPASDFFAALTTPNLVELDCRLVNGDVAAVHTLLESEITRHLLLRLDEDFKCGPEMLQIISLCDRLHINLSIHAEVPLRLDSSGDDRQLFILAAHAFVHCYIVFDWALRPTALPAALYYPKLESLAINKWGPAYRGASYDSTTSVLTLLNNIFAPELVTITLDFWATFKSLEALLRLVERLPALRNLDGRLLLAGEGEERSAELQQIAKIRQQCLSRGIANLLRFRWNHV